ncbi:MAG: substrate-binding domain-containing protein [Bacteroidia bacterium]|nr:substrate-binding domain-containing protein [Bacteroidia bacterium]
MKRTHLIFAVGLIVLATFISCAGGGAGATQSGPIRIAVIPKGTTHIFWNTVYAGADKAAKDLGVEIIWQGPQQESDRQRQIEIVQNAISQGVDAMVLAPLDSRSLVTPVRAAHKRGIPVVIFDSGLDAEEDYDSFVATDNLVGGRLCARRMADLIQGKGNILVMRYMEGSSSTHQREEGFLQGIAEYAPDAQLISTNQYAGHTVEKAFQAAQNLLNRYPEVTAIFCPNENTTQAMMRALETSGKAGKVTFVGFDSNEPLLEGLRKGYIQGLAVQDPFQIGYKGVATAVSILRKEPYEKRVDTGVQMLTAENLDSPEMKALLQPTAVHP